MALMAIGPSNAANPGGKPAGPVRPDAPVLTLARDEWRPAPAVAGERSWWRMSPAERRRKDLADLARVQRRSVVAGLAGAGIAALGLAAGAAPVAAVASAAPIVVAFGASVGVLALTLWGSAALIKAAMDRKN